MQILVMRLMTESLKRAVFLESGYILASSLCLLKIFTPVFCRGQTGTPESRLCFSSAQRLPAMNSNPVFQDGNLRSYSFFSLIMLILNKNSTACLECRCEFLHRKLMKKKNIIALFLKGKVSRLQAEVEEK
jgi:hypothetical protein